MQNHHITFTSVFPLFLNFWYHEYYHHLSLTFCHLLLGFWQLGGMGHYRGTWWKYMLHSQPVIDNVLNILNFWMNRSCSSSCSNITVYVLHGKEKCSPKLTSLKTLIDLFRCVSYHNFTVSVWTFIAYDKVSW